MRYRAFLSPLSCLYLGDLLLTFERLELLEIGIAEYDIDHVGFVMFLHLEANDEKFIMTRRKEC